MKYIFSFFVSYYILALMLFFLTHQSTFTSFSTCFLPLEECKNEQFNLENNNSIEKKIFLDHVIQKHTPSDKHCPFKRCNRPISNKDALKYHIYTFHIEKKNFQCHLCYDCFFCEDNYREHLINKHSSPKTLTLQQHHYQLMTTHQNKQGTFIPTSNKKRNHFEEAIPPLIHINTLKRALLLKPSPSSSLYSNTPLSTNTMITPSPLLICCFYQ